jgi:1-acyl-sn-glycerol-3-phosphate acyltransferase
VLSHANLLANVRAIGDAVEVRPDDVTVSWLPLYHDMGLIGAWLGTLYHAVPLVLMSPLAFIGRPARWLEAIHRHQGTITAAPNFAFDLCTRRIRDEELAGLDLSCLRAVYNGAEAVSPTTMERFIERFGSIGFRREAMMPVYGLAESSVALTFPPLGRAPLVDTVDRRLLARSGRAEPMEPGTTGTKSFVACGRPLPLHEVRIVDEQDRELPDRQEGHIQFKGPSATRGYLRNPEATARLLHGDWLDTGDLGYVAGGDLYVTGRAKDIIIKAGRNIYPEELEEAVGMAVLPEKDLRRGFARRVARLLARLVRVPIEVEGLEHLRSCGRPVVVAANHQSYFDSFVLTAALPPDFAFVAKRELRDRTLPRYLLERLGTVFVERFDPAQGVGETRKALDALAAGDSVIVFPEGTFHRAPGLLPFRMGAFLVAAEAGVPVVPVTLRGTRSLLRGDEMFPRRGAAAVTVSPPLQPAGSDWAAAVALRDAARAEILGGTRGPAPRRACPFG